MKTILITGATGAVGPRVVEAALRAGLNVRILALDPPQAGAIPRDIETRIGSVTDRPLVKEAMEGCSGVIHMAALLHIVNPSPDLRERYEQVNVQGTQVVTEIARELEVERLVFFSTIAVYGQGHAGEVLTEESTPHADTLYGETKLSAERIVLGTRTSQGNPLGTVLRMGAIYGSGIKGNYRRLALALARGRFVGIGRGDNRRTLVYDKDAAQAAILALTHPAAPGRTYNVTDGEYHTINDIVSSISRALDRPPPRLHLPAGPVRAAVRAAGLVLGPFSKKATAVASAVQKYLEEIVVNGELIRRELGFTPKYDLAAGWQECIAEMRQAGEL